MPLPEAFHRSWRALDDRMSTVTPTWWGAVVTDMRYPQIWDANYARIDTGAEDLTAVDVESALLPALARAGADTEHTVHFHPERTAPLLAELSSRGHRLSWDAVMELQGDPSEPVGVVVEELATDRAFWRRMRESMTLFEVVAGPAMDQLGALEMALVEAGVKRWFGVRGDDGSIASMAALIRLDDVGYLDNVATFPEARGRGLASAVTVHIAREARATGATSVTLLADPDDAAVVRLYERLGFKEVARLAATRGPVEQVQAGGAR